VNDYVAGGYAALAVILGIYAVHLRHRARVLARALPPRPRPPRPAPGARP
jgi:hypothetical protein